MRPKFSFQIYSTVDLGPDSPLHRYPRGMFKEDVGAWRLDVYSPLPDVAMCIEHQKRGIVFRHAQVGSMGWAGPIVENHDSYNIKTIMHGFIIVIDFVNWNQSGGRGPLFVHFDTRSLDQRIIEEGPTDGQIELRIDREVPTLSHGMSMVWANAGLTSSKRMI